MTHKLRILLGVTGGIAAYKSAELVRRLIDRGAEVQVVMTDAAQRFITPVTFQAVSGRPVRSDLWDSAAEAAMGHIELARWAQLVLIAPASADFIARLAGGRADDLLATHPWQEIKGSLRVPDGTNLLAVKIVRAPANTRIRGRVWIDDLRLAKK